MAQAEKPEGKKGGGGIGGLLIVTILALAVGGGFGIYMAPGFNSEDEPKAAAAGKEHEEAKPSVPVQLIELPPMIANLSEPKSAWMRVEASLVVEGEIDKPQVLSSKVAEDIVAYLKTTTLAQFEGASGFQNLREDLNDRVRVRGGSQVRELVIHGMVIE